MKVNKRIVASIIIILTIFLLFNSCGKNNKAEKVNTVLVTQGDITEKVIAIGNILPQQSITVKSPISGTVAQLFHEEGDFVKKDTPLLQVKPDPTPQDYAILKQQIEIERTKEKEYSADVTRYQSLLEKGHISQKDRNLGIAKSLHQQAYLQRTLNEQKLALLDKGEAKIGDHVIANVILSPSDGYILKRTVSLGDPVVAQTTSQPGNELFTIANMENLVFKGQVSETDIAKLRTHVPATIQIAAFPGIKIQGTLKKIGLQSVQADKNNLSSNANQSNSSNTPSPFHTGFKIEIGQLVFSKEIKLRAGYSAVAEIISASAKNSLLIPLRVVYFENDKPYVWLVDKKGSPKKQFIHVGLSDGMQIQVTQGLTNNQKVLENNPASS